MSHLVRSFSNTSRVPSHHQPAPPPPPAMSSPYELRHQAQRLISNRLVSSPLPSHYQHHHDNRPPSSYDPSQLIANEAPIDASLLVHDNPGHCCDVVSPLPLDQYKLNVDRNPLVVRRKPQEKIRYSQKIAVRYLKPPPPPKAGDILVCELPSKQVAPAPALVVRQAPPKPATPPPLVLR